MSGTADRSALLTAILASPSYRLAEADTDLLGADDLRPLRLQLELLKPERALSQHGIRSTVVVFGSARIVPSDSAPDTARARRQARYLDEARRFAALVSRRFQQEGRRDFVVVTGGGPGIMEAANRGAWEVGHARSASTSPCHTNRCPIPSLPPIWPSDFAILRSARCILRCGPREWWPFPAALARSTSCLRY